MKIISAAKKKIRFFSLTAETGNGHRSIKKPAELVEPAGAAPPVG
jgi:hypothetical protein